ncbi:HEAT repeat domain-containing protein [Amycolatopsis magusensis]|uniref:HEAT repeat domain-containing protein n=1 Tax=Amycolatopsis magusensis TaxID=882444 RepID=UPI0024A8F65E|nr:HEAT repeat domain-containing protein [Amycolatopsis magusensis]MDI5977903.1 HEAT repeat domain-containing protein [Amycolatopsis magusensis]
MSAPRVYVSSTYQDLKHCRSAIRLTLQRMGLDDIAMETYTAGEERPLDRCLDDVRSADVYVGVLAWRYGFVPAQETASITELEYRAAGEADVPRLMFVLDLDAMWPRSAMDRDSTLIDTFRDHVLDTHVCDTFVSVDELRAKVAEAVGRHLQERHGIAVGSDAAWESYCTRLIQEYQRLDLEALTPPDRDEHLQIALRDVFIEPDVRENMPDTELPKELLRKLAEAADPASSELPRGLDRHLVEQTRDSYRRQPARSAFDALASPLARTCVLLGDPGAGKSTLARYLALALAEQRTGPALAALEGWQPILIELRDYALKCNDYETFGSYLDYRKRTDGLGIEEATVETYLRDDGRALVVFDGLDEIFEPRLRETVSRRIAGFAAQFPTARVIVTSRVVGYRPRIFRGAGFVQYTVQDLDTDKVDVFLRRWYQLALHDRPAAIEMRQERLTRAINDSAPIRELAGNPLLLTILAIIGKHQELPRERWKVYDHAAAVLVQHWDVNKHLVDEDIDADVIREDDKKELLRKLAIRMQVGSHGFAGNSLLESDLLQDIETYLVGRFRYEPAKAAAISTAMVKQLRERNFIFARYGSGVYGFVHRALLEFFSASDVVNRFEKVQTLSEEDLVEQVILPRSEDPAWAEVLRLIVGMVDATVATRLVDRLLCSTGTHRSSALDRRPLATVALAAQCIAEIRNVNAAASAAEDTLRAIIELLESPTRSFGDDVRESHLEETVLPALSAVPAWPGRVAFRHWFVQRGQYATTTPAAKLGAQFLAALFQNDDQVRDLLHKTARSGIPQQREAALLGIAQCWKTAPETIALVAGGLADEEAFLRRTCLDLLVTNWPDDQRAHDLMLRAVKDADANVRSRAIEALAQHANKMPAAWSTVTRALRGDAGQSVRKAAVTALAASATDPQETMALLLHACADPAWAVRRSALQAVVARFATDPAVFDRVRAAARDSDEDVRQTAVELLASRWPGDAVSVHAARRAIRDADPKVRLAAVRVMAQRWHDDPEVAEVLKQAQNDYDGDVRVAALTAWSDPIGHRAEYVAVLEAVAVEDPVADARRAALETLVSNSAEYGGPALDHGIADPSPDVRAAALRSLSGVTPQLSRFRPGVLRLCEDAAESVRRLAVEVAARFWGDRPETVRILQRAARSRFSMVRRSALESLASRWPDDTETVRALHRGRRDPDDSVRYTATIMSASLASGIEELTAAVDAAIYDSAPRLRRWAGALACVVTAEVVEASAPTTRTSAMRRAGLHTTARSGFGEDAVSAVRTATDDPDPDVRLAAAEIISARRGAFSDALNLVTQFSRDENPEIRSRGLAVLLAAWPDHDKTSNARSRGLTDPSEEIRRLALESLIVIESDAPAVRRAVTAAMIDTDWIVRRLALDTLCLRWHDEPEVRTSIRAALHHVEQDVRQAAADTLWGAYPDEESTFTALVDCARDPSARRRMQVLRDLAMSRPHDRRVRDLLAMGRCDHDPTVAVAAWELQRGAADSNAFEETRQAAGLRHPDVVARQLGADRLARLPAITDVDEELFRIGIRDNSDSIRSAVGFALTSIADEHRVKSILRNAGSHPNFRARIVDLEVRTARWPDSTESYEAIRRALKDLHHLVRYTALNLLVGSRPMAASSFETVLPSLGDLSWIIRSSAIRIVATFHPDGPKALQFLSLALHDCSSNNRQTALNALIIGWPRHTATSTAVEEAETDVVSYVREFARYARMRLHPQVISTAAPATSQRSTALERLRDCDLRFPDDEVSRQVVLDSTKSADWRIRQEALQVLARRWPDRPETELAFTQSATDENEEVREVVMRRQAGADSDSRARVAMLRTAALGPSRSERRDAVDLLALWRTPETQEVLLEAARDRRIDVHNVAIQELVTGWPVDSRTRDALGWAVCSSFEWLHNMAFERLSGNDFVGSLHRSTPSTVGRVEDLLLQASWGSEDPDVTAVLQEQSPCHDVIRVALLTNVLSNTSATAETRSLLLSAMHDVCPAVRRLALQGLARMGDPAWISNAITDSDPYLRSLLCTLRSVTDPSPEFSAELIQTLHDEPDDTFSALIFQIATTRAGAGLLEPTALADATGAAPYLTSGDREWLQWLVRITNAAGHTSGETDEIS